MIFLLFRIRFGTIAFLAMGIMAIIRKDIAIKHKKIGLYNAMMVFFILVFYFAYDYIQELSDGKLSDNLIRNTNGGFFRGTTIATLISLPFPINIAACALFFFFVPLFTIPQPSPITDYYLVSTVFCSFLTPFFMFFLWYYIFNAIFSYFSKKDRNLETLLVIVLSFCFVLGTVSLQIRHKTVLFPFLCMLAAYGMTKFNKHEKNNSFAITAAFIVIQLVLAIKAIV